VLLVAAFETLLKCHRTSQKHWVFGEKQCVLQIKWHGAERYSENTSHAAIDKNHCFSTKCLTNVLNNIFNRKTSIKSSTYNTPWQYKKCHGAG
jgi:hypothetical protein